MIRNKRATKLFRKRDTIAAHEKSQVTFSMGTKLFIENFENCAAA